MEIAIEISKFKKIAFKSFLFSSELALFKHIFQKRLRLAHIFSGLRQRHPDQMLLEQAQKAGA